MTSRILVLGANGMLGGSIFRYFSALPSYEVIGSVRSAEAETILRRGGYTNIVSSVDAYQFITIERLIQEMKPDIVINCIGVIKQLESAKSPIRSIEINSILPHKLAKACSANRARLIHFSTDCVFDGAQGMYNEWQSPNSNDLYGRSKLLGEVDYGEHLTLRTSIIGHELNSHVSLVDWFLNQEGSVSGYAKAIFSGLPTIYVAEFLDKYVLDKCLTGLFHLSVEPIDKYSLLSLIAEVYDKSINLERSENVIIDRSLDSSKLRKAVGFQPLQWRKLVEKMYDEYRQYFT